jgi:AcrR family transcriptional regulator
MALHARLDRRRCASPAHRHQGCFVLEGVPGLTMPTLARRLDCGVMTLYGYVESKRDLLEAIVQRGLQDLQVPRPLPLDATGVLSTWGRTLRLTLLRHPAPGPGMSRRTPV